MLSVHKMQIIRNFFLLLLFLSPVVAEEQKVELTVKELELNISVLNEKIIPIRGAKKDEIIRIFGNSKDIDKSKDNNTPQPLIYSKSYRLLSKNALDDKPVSLNVIFHKNKVFKASITHPNLNEIATSSANTLAGKIATRENNEIIFRNLLKIYNKYHRQLKDAPWNKSALEN